MRLGNCQLTKEQRVSAIHRLTALWAFTESGLGGVMHALQIPFTGLVVGGMAVIMISLIGEMTDRNYKQILKSAMIVLIVKAMVSPYTPFPAYIAVSFQAILGYGLFSLLRVNFLSIAFLSTLAMLESAIQKLLILTLFFGESIWKAMDNMIALLATQFGSLVTNGSYWVVGIYLLIYLTGGFLIAWLAYNSIKNFNAEKPAFVLTADNGDDQYKAKTSNTVKTNSYKKLWILISTMLVISALLFLSAADHTQGWLAVAKTVSWTISAVLIWFVLIGPLFTKGIQKLLQKKQSRYRDEVLKTLSFLPVLKQLTTRAWQQSKLKRGFKRWHFFFASLIHATLTYTEVSSIQST